jgi:DNA-binding SARP family transcriptional activator/WD40 repeat protein/energy-coupling factor transporter ATP-binding protein EcfA2
MGIAMLGPLVVNGEEGRLGHRDRVVLAALAARAGEVVTSEELADALWGEAVPATWSKVVQGCVVRLRKLLGSRAIITADGGYRLSVPSDDIDVYRFERLLGRGRELLVLSEPERAAYVLDEAISLWRGPALRDLENWDPGRTEAARLDELHRDAEELRVDASLRGGHCREVLGEAQRLVGQAPLRERRWALLALAQYQAGMQAQALRSLRQARTVLAAELGLDPGPDLVALEQAILRQDPSLVVEAVLPDVSATCPYQGLLPYDVRDSDAYFGRDAEIADCRSRLATQGVLVVVGPSGSGKSSLVRAGVAAALEREGRRIHAITPGRRPLDALIGLQERVGDVLVVDQCEEAVLLCHDPAERETFFARLSEHAERGGLVVALRADRIGEITEHAEFARMVERGLFLLAPMGTEQLHACIEGPARQAGLLLEPGLVDLLVREVEDEPGALPLLSHALRQTWKHREGRTLTVSGYHASGGIRGAVARSAEGVHDRLPPHQRPLLRALMLRLVGTTAAGELVRSRIPRALVTGDAAHDHVVDLLVEARLVTSDDGALEVAHEALVRAWPRLRAWLEEDVDGQRVLRHLADAAQSWQAMGRPDSELYRGVRLAQALDWRERTAPDLAGLEEDFLHASRAHVAAELDEARRHAALQTVARRRTRRLAAGLAVALVLALVAAVAATRYQVAAEDRAVEAGRAATLADANRLAALSTSVGSLDLSLLLAAEGARTAATPATGDALLDTLVEHRRATQVVALPGRPWDGELADHGRALYVPLTDRMLRWEVGSLHRPTEFTDWFGTGDIGTSARSDRIATWSWRDDETLQVGVFDGGSRLLLHQTGLEQIGGWPHALGLSPDGAHLVEVVGVEGARGIFRDVVRVVDVATGEQLARYPGQRSSRPDVFPTATVADDGSAAVSWTDEDAPSATRVDLRTGRSSALAVPRRDAVGVSFVALPTGAAELWSDGTVTLFDRHGRRTQDLDAHSAPVNDVVVSPDHSWAVTGDDAGTVLVWRIDPGSGRWSQREELAGHAGGIAAIAVAPSGRSLVTVSSDSTAISWDVSDDAGFGSPVPGLGDHWISNRPATILPGRLVVAPVRPAPSSPERFGEHGSGTFAVSAAFLDPVSGQVLDIVPVHRTLEGALFGSSVSVSPERTLVAVTYATGTAVLDVATHKIVHRIELPPTGERDPEGRALPELVWSSAWTPDGTRLLLGADGKGFDATDGNLAVVDTATWQVRPARIPLNSTGAQTMAFSPDRRWLAVGMSNATSSGQPAGTVDVLDANTLRRVRRVELGASNFPFDVAFSPDSRLVAAAGDHGFLAVFGREDGALLHDPVKVHNQFAQQVAWTPDGRTVVTTGADGTIALYDVRRGLVRAGLPGSAGAASGFTYLLLVTRDQVSALTGEQDGRSYPLDPRRWLDYACVVVGRDLTQDEWARYLPARPYRRTCTDRPGVA